MGIFTNGIHRKNNGLDKQEEYSQIYYEPVNNPNSYFDYVHTILYIGEYKNYEFVIKTTGSNPYIQILVKKQISPFIGTKIMNLTDRNNEPRKAVVCSDGPHMGYPHRLIFDISYNNDGDFQWLANKTGKKYTLSELKQDAEAFVRNLYNAESNFDEWMI